MIYEACLVENLSSELDSHWVSNTKNVPVHGVIVRLVWLAITTILWVWSSLGGCTCDNVSKLSIVNNYPTEHAHLTCINNPSPKRFGQMNTTQLCNLNNFLAFNKILSWNKCLLRTKDYGLIASTNFG